MKEIAFIDGKTRIAIKDSQLAVYLENIESAGYVVKANKCKGREGFIDILMIGKDVDFQRFFGGYARVREIFKQYPRIYRFLFNRSELVIYILARDDMELIMPG